MAALRTVKEASSHIADSTGSLLAVNTSPSRLDDNIRNLLSQVQIEDIPFSM